MKKVFKSILVTVAAALAFASCQREGDVNGTEGRTVRFLAGPVETRTAFSTPDATGQYPVLWTENDTKVKVSLNMASGVDATVTPNGATAEFEASVNTENAEAPYTFYALSPATAYFSISSKYMDWGLQISSDQVPSAGTPDEAAQVLAGVSAACTSLDEVITVNFSHVTAYGRMTLTGLDLAGAAVTGVSLTAEVPLAGRFFYYVADTNEHSAGDVVANSTSNTLNLITDSVRDIWFACAPADISGTTLVVTVYTANGLYEKAITVPANRKFEAGKIAKFTIDMTGATRSDSKEYELVTDPAQLSENSIVIIADKDGSFAMNTTQNSNNRSATVVMVNDDKIINPFKSVEELTIEAGAGGTVAFKAGTAGYLAATGTSSNQLTTVAETGANTNFTVTISDGEANVNAAGVSCGQMRFNPNSGNPIFNCYTSGSTTGAGIALYKLVGSGSDEPIFQATLEGANESGLLTVPASATSAVINVISNVDWVIYSDDDVEFSEEEGNSSASVEVTFPANETEEPVTYTINIESDLGEYEFVITQEAFVPAGESVYRKVTSVTAGKKYILAALVDGEVKAMTPIASGSSYGFPAATKVSETDGVIDTRHTELELTFTAVTGGYSIQQPDSRYWAMTGNYNSINVYNSAQESYIWTVTANNDGTVDVVNTGKSKHIVYDGSHTNFAAYASVNSSNIYPSLYEYIDGSTPVDPPVGEESWVKTALTAITSSDVFVIVGNNGADYAMSNDNGASAAPAAVSVTVASDGNSLTAAPAANLQWKLTAASGSYTFYPNGDSSKWLYCTANNNGLRVGTGDKKTFSLNSNYLYNDGQARYVGIYSEQGTAKDWRSYTSINNNIKDQTFAFFVKTAGGGEPPVVETVATPTFSPAAGEVEAGTAVTISCATSGATIHYTTDGSTPTASSATGTSVTVNAAMTIKAIAVKSGMNDSAVATAAYTVQSAPPSGDGWFKTALSAITSSDVFVIVGNNGANFAMSNDNGTGSAPAAVSVSVASDGNSLTAAPAANLQWNLTAASGSYTFYPNADDTKWLYCTNSNNGLRVGTGDKKTFSLNSNYLYNDGQTRFVGIYSEEGAAKDWRSYTSINNNIKDQTFSFFVKSGNGGGEPPVETVATPTFSPAAGAVAMGTTVTISCATSGATIHYTTDGTTPTASSATGTSVTVNAAMTIKAIAVKSGMNDSAVATANYTIQSQSGATEYVLTWSAANNLQAVGGYTNNWTATANGFTWNMVNWNNNNNSWNYVKCGSKSAASTATITTASAIPEAIKTVQLTIDALTVSKITSISLYVSSTSSFGSTPVGTFTAATGTQSVTISSPVTNQYYKIEVVCQQGSSNGLLTLSKVLYSTD